ncbi:MAG: hypothetical protein V4564_14385 [Pseudomonadota bacterium]
MTAHEALFALRPLFHMTGPSLDIVAHVVPAFTACCSLLLFDNSIMVINPLETSQEFEPKIQLNSMKKYQPK